MEVIGEFLERAGRPFFGVAFFVLIIASAIAMLAISTVTLWRHRRAASGHA